VKGDATTKAVNPIAQPAKLTGRTIRRSGIARKKTYSTEQSLRENEDFKTIDFLR